MSWSPAKVPGPPPGTGKASRSAGSTAAGRRSRERILRAALGLITEIGIDSVRLAEIARRAGMSSGQVMYYFESKEHILLETLAMREGEETASRRKLMPRTPPGWPRLELFVDLYLPEDATDPVWILWIEAWARAPHRDQFSDFLDGLMQPWREDLAAIIDQGVTLSMFRRLPPDSDFPLRFCAVLDGLSVLYLRQMPQQSRDWLIHLALTSAAAELGGPAS